MNGRRDATKPTPAYPAFKHGASLASNTGERPVQVTFSAACYAFVMVRLARRDLVWINVTAYPTAEWIAQQIT